MRCVLCWRARALHCCRDTLQGGGISILRSKGSMSNSNVSYNELGFVDCESGDSFSSNGSPYIVGGGLYCFNSSFGISIVNSSFSFNDGSISNSKDGLSGSGGGMHVDSNCTLSLLKSSIFRNNAVNGGGISYAGQLTVTQSSVYNNAATQLGSALYARIHSVPNPNATFCYLNDSIFAGNLAQPRAFGSSVYIQGYTIFEARNTSMHVQLPNPQDSARDDIFVLFIADSFKAQNGISLPQIVCPIGYYFNQINISSGESQQSMSRCVCTRARPDAAHPPPQRSIF